ncbi:NAD(P)-binding domain-containing protein [Parvularcula sp. IMCC14364]|uniref:NAD(P)-binding domain-containing protein n=1 Tax=Parvularcula sp. IMCC14364 TaxID=3067902 RepID=UPI002741ACE3|nr:NAD(P)-binding domain-containing protein [Parvularcula sp. IMCC14364]
MGQLYKIAIVGSGPAGLSAAVHAAKLGISHVLLEKTDHLSDTIYKYQKGKYVMATPEVLVLRSDISFQAGKREEILGTWDSESEFHQTNVQYNADVNKITGERGNFKIETAAGDTIMAEHVVLAIGTQGNPNKLRCPGGDLPFVQYQLDDPKEYFDENIIIVGGGDAGIENALGLSEDAGQGNNVVLLQRSNGFPRSKPANVSLLEDAKAQGKLDFLIGTTPLKLEPGVMTVETPDGQAELPVDRVIARLGSAPPRRFVEDIGIEFTGPDRDALPVLSEVFESSTPGIFVVGALAGYPLIKHCANQGYDVVEFVNGNTDLKPADEPILRDIFKDLPGGYEVSEWLEILRNKVDIFRDVSILQLREFMLESTMHYKKKGEVVFKRNELGDSLFAVVGGTVNVEINPNDPSIVVPLGDGEIFGEIGLISGRRRGATIRSDAPSILVEMPARAAKKLIATIPSVKRAVDEIATERQIKQIFGNDISPEWVDRLKETSEMLELKSGETIIQEGEVSTDVFIIRSGSVIVEKNIGGKEIFISYVAAGALIGEMALFEEGKRTATVRTTIKSEIIKLQGDIFSAMMEERPMIRKRIEETIAARREVNSFIESQKSGFGSVVDMYSSVANFLLEEGLGEATDALLIDESLCVGCDNCEVACAETHQGISRLDREAGKTYANIHVPTSCRHCEHPHCMGDCPPDAIRRAPDGEVFINETCIGCGNCQRNCPYGVIQMERVPPKKPGLLQWLLFGAGPGPGQPSKAWVNKVSSEEEKTGMKVAVKCDMCKGIKGGPACVRACPTGAAIRVSPEQYLNVAQRKG